MKRKLYIIVVNLAVLLAVLACAELGSRLIFPGDTIPPIFDDQDFRTRQRPYFQYHATRGFALKPGFSDGIYTVDSKGFRQNGPHVKDRAVPAGQKTILAMGESTTFGWGVQDHETYPAHLAQMFPREDQVAVVNGGVPSYTSSQVRIYLQEILDRHLVTPDLVLINILWNDIWYATIRNWHPDILVHQQPPGWLSFLTTHSQFCRMLVMGTARNNTQVDVFNTKALGRYEKNIEQMMQVCRQANIPAAFVMPPFDADHMPEEGLNEFHVRYSRDFFIQTAHAYIQRLRALAERYGVPVIPHQLDTTYLHQKPFFLDALHPTAEGNARMASDIFNYIKNKEIQLFKKWYK